jgi:hypothetical protein
MDGLNSGDLDGNPGVAGFHDLDGSVEILAGKLQRQHLSILTGKDKASALEERVFCTSS